MAFFDLLQSGDEFAWFINCEVKDGQLIAGLAALFPGCSKTFVVYDEESGQQVATVTLPDELPPDAIRTPLSLTDPRHKVRFNAELATQPQGSIEQF